MLLCNVWGEKLRFSSIFKWCLPFAAFIHGDIHNLAFGSFGTSKPVPYSIPWSKHLSDSPSVRRLRNDFVVTSPEVALQPVTQRSLGSFATSITTPTKKAQTSIHAHPKKLLFAEFCSRAVRNKSIKQAYRRTRREIAECKAVQSTE